MESRALAEKGGTGGRRRGFRSRRTSICRHSDVGSRHIDIVHV